MRESDFSDRSFNHKLLLVVLPLLLIVATPSGGLSSAQVASADPGAFEVASVRPDRDCANFSMSPDGSRLFTVTQAPMAFLIELAYAVPDEQLAKEPSWLRSKCYSISARAPGEGRLDSKELTSMLRDLLSKRFHLASHSESRDVSGFGLVVSNKDLNLHTAEPGPSTGVIEANGLRARNFTMKSFASLLSRAMGSTVIDQTGLTGKYDVDLSFARDIPSQETDSQLPSVFNALQEQLGLKLVAHRVTIKMMVVDHIDESPTAN